MIEIAIGTAATYAWAAECPQFAVAQAEQIDGNTGYVWNGEVWLEVEFSQFLGRWVLPEKPG